MEVSVSRYNYQIFLDLKYNNLIRGGLKILIKYKTTFWHVVIRRRALKAIQFLAGKRPHLEIFLTVGLFVMCNSANNTVFSRKTPTPKFFQWLGFGCN